MNLRKFLSVVLLLGTSVFTASAAGGDDKQALVLTLKSGERLSWFLEALPKLSFSATELYLETEDALVTYPLEEVENYTFSLLPTGIFSPRTDRQGAVNVTKNEVRFTRMQPGTVATVYTADGRKLQTVTIASDGSAVLSLAGLPVGTYIINYGVSTCKILKR